jgi:hypothetical protein
MYRAIHKLRAFVLSGEDTTLKSLFDNVRNLAIAIGICTSGVLLPSNALFDGVSEQQLLILRFLLMVLGCVLLSLSSWQTVEMSIRMYRAADRHYKQTMLANAVSEKSWFRRQLSALGMVAFTASFSALFWLITLTTIAGVSVLIAVLMRSKIA